LQFLSLKRDSGGHVTAKNLPGLMKKLRGLSEVVSENDIAAFLSEVFPEGDQEIEFEQFLQVDPSCHDRSSAFQLASNTVRVTSLSDVPML
jgi:plastin-1